MARRAESEEAADLPMPCLHESALLFKALCSPVRLRMLVLLKQGELCGLDLHRALEISDVAAKTQVNYLRRARLVTGYRRGKLLHYRLQSPATRLHRTLINALPRLDDPVVFERDAVRLREVAAHEDSNLHQSRSLEWT